LKFMYFLHIEYKLILQRFRVSVLYTKILVNLRIQYVINICDELINMNNNV